MKSHKLIETKQIKFWRRAKLATWLIPVLFLIWQIPTYVQVLPEVIKQNGMLLTIVMIVIGIGLSSTIPMLIWWLISSQMLKGAEKRARVKSVLDIDYYRDKLDGLSPTTISLLMDLRVEEGKDLTASLLKLEMDGKIRLTDGGVEILEEDTSKLGNADYELMEILKNKENLRGDDLKERLRIWKNSAISDALGSPYFCPAEQIRMRAFLPGCVTPIICGIFMMVTYLSGILQYSIDVMERILDSGYTQAEAFQLLMSDWKAMLGIAFGLIDVILLFVIFLFPMLFAIYVSVKSAMSDNKLKRTELGNEVMEYVYGLKNFIHDFSNLAEATKEQIVLWDDFLIYAVVLEENDIILKEILQKRNISTDILKWRIKK